MFISTTEFKAKCLEIIRKIDNFKTEIIITKHKKPLVKIIPFNKNKKSKKTLFGLLKGNIKIKSDLTKPLNEKWDVN